MNVAVSLLDQAWPLEPLRQISVKLLNLKDDKGKMSASASEVNYLTGGKTKLGGNPKEVVRLAPQTSETSAPLSPLMKVTVP
jgi:hypothetical protein